MVKCKWSQGGSELNGKLLTRRRLRWAFLYTVLLAVLLSIVGVVLWLVLHVPFVAMRIYIIAAAVIVAIAATLLPLFVRTVRTSLTDNRYKVCYSILVSFESEIVFDKIAYISIIRGPFERICRLSLLLIYTPGTVLIVPAVDIREAVSLRCVWRRYMRKNG